MSTTTSVVLDRDQLANWYAKRHQKIDDGVDAIFYLPQGALPREVRLLEVNTLIAEMQPLEAIDFGVGIGSDLAHTLFVLDVTPTQWQAIRAGSLSLPDGWTLNGSQELFRRVKS